MGEQELIESKQDEPPSCWRNIPQCLVAVIANLKGETSGSEDEPPDAGAEFDSIRTITAIQTAIESDGHQTVFLPADAELPGRLKDFRPDICFNIAEGLGGDAREAQVPAVLEMLGIPYTGSRVLTNAIALDKAMTKRLWQQAGLPVAAFQEFVNGDEPLDPGLYFPLFVKPNREGSGMGVDGNALVRTEVELRERVKWIIRSYAQSALVEEYLPGREFTVGVLGRPGAESAGRRPELYASDGYHRFPISEVVNGEQSITPGIYSHAAKVKDLGEEDSVVIQCPALLDWGQQEQLYQLAIQAHQVIGARDISRVDIRMNAQGEPCLMEINTLPGMSPDFSDLCLMANAEFLSYQDLVLEILYLAANTVQSRSGLTVSSFSSGALTGGARTYGNNRRALTSATASGR